MSKGFTLIEVLVVMGITVLMTSLLVANFSRTRMDLNQATITVKDAIRTAQSMALSGSSWNQTSRCGYGIHFSASQYIVYAGPVSDGTACASGNYRYNMNGGIVSQGLISNSVLEISTTVTDIFFEPPNPKTYFDGNAAKAEVTILVRRKSSACPSADCRQINVTTSGQIQ